MQLPLVPLRDVVIFPGVVTSLFVGRDKSIKSLRKLELIKVEKIENEIYISKIN